MKEKFICLLFLFILRVNFYAQNCQNIGFENGTTTGWRFDGGHNFGTNNPSSNNLISGIGFHSIVTNTSTVGTQCTNGIDNYGGFPVVASDGGTYSLLLNNNLAGSKVVSATAGSFVITPAMSSFTFKFASVLQDVGHSDSTKPYFFIKVRGHKNFNSLYTDFHDTSLVLTGWQTSQIDSSVHFLPWTNVTIDLKSQISYNYVIYVDFFLNDCNDGQHFGYSYIDGTCNNYNITSSNALCQIGDSTVLNGPPGMVSYNWNGPTNSTSQSIGTNLPGNYTLTTTSYFDFPPPDTLYYQLVEDTVKSAFAVNATCSNVNAYFVDQSSGSPNFWQWNFGDASFGSNSQNPLHLYNTPGTYTVSLIAGNSCGQLDTSYSLITIYPLPLLPIINPPIYCYSGQNILICDTISTNISHLWIGPQVGSSGACVQVSTYINSPGGTYTLTVSDANACSNTTYFNVSFNFTPTVSFVLQKDTSQIYTWNAIPNYSSNTSNATWYWGDGSSSIGLYPAHTFSAAGWYNICVTAYNSCGDSISFCQNDSIYRMANNSGNAMIYINVLNNTTNINNIESNNYLNIYPNPSSGIFQIKNDKLGVMNFEIYNVMGKNIFAKQIDDGNTEIDLSKESKGVYFYRIKNDINVLKTGKIIIE